jgi:hypothetical protein
LRACHPQASEALPADCATRRRHGLQIRASEETATNTYEVLETAELYAVQWTVGSVKGELVLPKSKL